MSVFRFYLDCRRADNLGQYPLRLAFTKERKTAYITTEIRLREDQWDADNGMVVRHPKAKTINGILIHMLGEAEQAYFDNRSKYMRWSAADIMKTIKIEIGEDTAPLVQTFVSRYIRFASRKKNARTKEIYDMTLTHMRRFAKNLDELKFEDITHRWLMEFEDYLSQTSPSANARSIHFRNIRAVFNDAIDDEVTTYYPFRKFKIKKEPTRKRSLSIEQLARLFSYPVEEYARWYHDYFMLSFYLIGINTHDLCYLEEIYNGRIEYKRAKTGKLYSIKVEPEALAIINRHRGERYLLDALDRFRQVRSVTQYTNTALQEIGKTMQGKYGRRKEQALHPDISMYWARHSWATLAAYLDIPKETIAAALGHGGRDITDIYIRFDEKKIDEANRKVIDALNAEIERQQKLKEEGI